MNTASQSVSIAVSTSEWIIRLSFFAAGVIHALPTIGVLGRTVLERAYGISLGHGHDLQILMQHRALLFGLLSASCFIATFLPSWRWPVGTAALISMLGFAIIAAWQPHGAAIARVMWIDIAMGLLLAVGLLLHYQSTLRGADPW